MAELKTKVNDASIIDFLESIIDPHKKQDCYQLLELMKAAGVGEPKMWGDSIIGFGRQHLKYPSGRELDWFRLGFSPRKNALTLYNLGGFEDYQEMLGRLGKFKTGKGCLYINKLADVDLSILAEIINKSARRP
jgi:hypothetical protein